MSVNIRYHSVKELPNKGRLHASIACKKCTHVKSFLDPVSKEIITQWEEKAFCSKCKSRDFFIDVFEVEKLTTSPRKTGTGKYCIVCGDEIEEQTLFAVPHTKCCRKHLRSNPTVKTELNEPLGTREDFKKDSRSNWGRSRSNKI